MFFELIATFVAGLGAAGMVHLLNVVSGRRLPRWLMPAGAGLAMLGFTIWSEYNWAERTTESMPEGLVVVSEVEKSWWWKPWTYARPQVVRVMTADLATVRTNPETPDIKLVSLYLFARWNQPAEVIQLVDCAKANWAFATPEAVANPEEDGVWHALDQDDSLYGALCTS